MQRVDLAAKASDTYMSLVRSKLPQSGGCHTRSCVMEKSLLVVLTAAVFPAFLSSAIAQEPAKGLANSFIERGDKPDQK